VETMSTATITRKIAVTLLTCLVLVMGIILAFVYALHGGDSRSRFKVIAASQSSIVGSWRDAGGIEIEFDLNGHFAASNWPTWGSGVDDSSRYEYFGTWYIEDIGAGSPKAVVLYFYPEIIRGRSAPDTVVLVRVDGGSVGICAQEDPDSPCAYGVLKRS
jgi:hypothetical protein